MDLHGGSVRAGNDAHPIDRVADRAVSAELAKPRLRAKLPQLHKALTTGSPPITGPLLTQMLTDTKAATGGQLHASPAPPLLPGTQPGSTSGPGRRVREGGAAV